MVLVTRQKENDTKEGLLDYLRGEQPKKMSRDRDRVRESECRSIILKCRACMDGAATKILAAVAAVVAAAAFSPPASAAARGDDARD